MICGPFLDLGTTVFRGCECRIAKAISPSAGPQASTALRRPSVDDTLDTAAVLTHVHSEGEVLIGPLLRGQTWRNILLSAEHHGWPSVFKKNRRISPEKSQKFSTTNSKCCCEPQHFCGFPARATLKLRKLGQGNDCWQRQRGFQH